LFGGGIAVFINLLWGVIGGGTSEGTLSDLLQLGQSMSCPKYSAVASSGCWQLGQLNFISVIVVTLSFFVQRQRSGDPTPCGGYPATPCSQIYLGIFRVFQNISISSRSSWGAAFSIWVTTMMPASRVA